MFAFEQCLLCLGHHADFWYEAAQFLEQSSAVLTEKGVSIVRLNIRNKKNKTFFSFLVCFLIFSFN